ncbi:MAG TPA: DUF4407 domain-containing protein, partial [Pseudonocardia sp.]|nr:DUF4407 domain-containing protein [Pseudonocardia sp.]
MSSPASPTPLAHPLVWLGGGNWRDIDDHAERSTYLVTGFFVALNALVAGTVAGAVAGAVAPPGWLFGLLFGTAAGLLVGAVGRVLAATPADPDRSRTRLALGDLTKALVAVLIGLVVGELAAVAVFAGAVDRELHGGLNAPGAAAVAGVPDRQLDALRTDRAALDTQVAGAAARRDQALVVARCEYHPGPGCPTTQITGDPGRGPETTQADAALAAAERDLTEATARRDQQAPGLDRDIADTRAALDRNAADTRALAAADTGVDARWVAMHAYTTASAAPLVLRLAVDALFVLLNLLPLLLRRWRGQTGQDRRVLARALRDRAEL